MESVPRDPSGMGLRAVALHCQRGRGQDLCALQVHSVVHAGHGASAATAVDGDGDLGDKVRAVGGGAKDSVEVKGAAFMATMRGGASGVDIKAVVVWTLAVVGRTEPGEKKYRK